VDELRFVKKIDHGTDTLWVLFVNNVRWQDSCYIKLELDKESHPYAYYSYFKFRLNFKTLTEAKYHFINQYKSFTETYKKVD
jgi:hypothetical protein